MNRNNQRSPTSDAGHCDRDVEDRFVSGVVVPNANLQLQQCGLPKRLAIELYKELLVQNLTEDDEDEECIEQALFIIDHPAPFVWDKLEALMRSHWILLRFPSRLTRACVQSFQPILTEGNAIHIHPIIAQYQGIDFSGQTATAFLPTSLEAQVEAHLLTSPICSLREQQHGQLGLNVSQEAAIGCYHLTYWSSADQRNTNRLDQVPIFGSTFELEMALHAGSIQASSAVRFRLPAGSAVAFEYRNTRLIATTAGRILFNEMLPVGMPFYNKAMKKNDLTGIIKECLSSFGYAEAMRLLERINQLGLKHLTRSGLSLGIQDLYVPDKKETLLSDARKQIERRENLARRELISSVELVQAKLDIWTQAIATLRTSIAQLHTESNPDSHLICSNGLVTVDTLMQLCGAIGSFVRTFPTDHFGTIRIPPICSNFREGVRSLDYFVLSHSRRRALLRNQTKERVCSRLFRKVSKAMRNVRISTHDCGTAEGILISAVDEEEELFARLSERIAGRVSLERIVYPYTDKVIVDRNELINRESAEDIERTGRHTVTVRSPLTCKAPTGVCQLCYGIDPAGQRLVEVESNVGIQSAFALCSQALVIGDLRTFRFGDPYSSETEQKVVSVREGIVSFDHNACVVNRDGQTVVIEKVCVLRVNDPRGRELETFELPYAAKLLVQNEEPVHRGRVIAEWKPNCDTILANRRGVVWLRDIVRKREPDRQFSGPMDAVPWLVGKCGSRNSPRLTVIDEHGSLLQEHFLDQDTVVYVRHSAEVLPGDLIAEWRHPIIEPEWKQLTPTVEDLEKLLEIARPRQSALLADFDATLTVNRVSQGRELVLVHEESGREIRHFVPDGTNLNHYSDARVKAGEPLTWSDVSPLDILRILGLRGLQEHLLSRLTRVYRRNRIDIAEQHLELVVHQLTRYCQAIDSGDSDWVPAAGEPLALGLSAIERLTKTNL